MSNIKTDPRVREYLNPVRIVYTYGDVRNECMLLEDSPTQVLNSYDNRNACKLGKGSYVVLDFGKELNG
ncbi:MAG: hypothetical protein ACI4DY_04530, partial [Monoglobaceae bacterium]